MQESNTEENTEHHEEALKVVEDFKKSGGKVKKCKSRVNKVVKKTINPKSPKWGD
jgi:hypothetical protein